MDVFAQPKIDKMYQKYGITPPSEFDTKEDTMKKQSKLYQKQFIKMQKIISNFNVLG